MTPSKKFFEDIYRKYNKKEFIYSDPLQFPKLFKEKKDKSILKPRAYRKHENCVRGSCFWS